MNTVRIDAAELRKAFVSAARNLSNHREYVNMLNVFPVPDGDTGTNMTMTLMAAVAGVEALQSPDMSALCRAMSQGTLRGARGNSGVILSQLLRGFCKVVESEDRIDSRILAAAFRKGTDTAYKAVMKPKEGTILTVARAMADKAEALQGTETDLIALLKAVIDHGEVTLARTPEMLPVLKEAGVVDSGGQGLILALKGALSALEGKMIYETGAEEGAGTKTSASPQPDYSVNTDSEEELRFGYCTEFIVNTEGEPGEEMISGFRAFLDGIGDSIVLVADEGLLKVHVHTNHPGLAFEEGLKFGSLTRMKVDNLREEQEEKRLKDAARRTQQPAGSEAPASPSTGRRPEEPVGEPEPEKKQLIKQPHKTNAFIAVSPGEGISEIFKSIGASFLIGGGQTMNPCAEDMIEAVEIVNADNIFILPNNKNIILAAEQTAGILSDKNIYVIPSKTVPQGISAMLSVDPSGSPEDIKAGMMESIAAVSTCEITYAVRNTLINGHSIREGDIMAIGDKDILAVGELLNPTALEAVKEMADGDTSLITIYRGTDISQEDGEHLRDMLNGAFPGADVVLEYGGQPVYYYIISAE